MTQTVSILLVDDNTAIHESFKNIFSKKEKNVEFDNLNSLLFDSKIEKNHTSDETFRVDSAYQGMEGLHLVKKSVANKQKYSIVFMDIRMPPGMDGIETMKKIWEIDPDLPIVIISAYFDYSFEDISTMLNNSKRFLILKKPFDIVEIRQIVNAFTRKNN